MQRNDLISRAALCEMLKKRIGTPEGDATLMEINLCIVEAPAVDAASVVHGRWKAVKAGCSNNYPSWDSKCSVCGYTTAMTQTGWLYCPHCGARMDEREGE